MEAAELMKITSHELLRMEIVDKVIEETGLSNQDLITSIKQELLVELEQLSSWSVEELVDQRYQRFRKY